jgi:hypothetical protein
VAAFRGSRHPEPHPPFFNKNFKMMLVKFQNDVSKTLSWHQKWLKYLSFTCISRQHLEIRGSTNPMII